MDRCISKNQSAFIPCRSIFNNTILAQEGFHSITHSKKKDGLLTVKLDLDKAYDKVDWGFLLSMLSVFGFPNVFIKWIETCNTFATFSVSINRKRCGFIKPTRGIRQGCPLSPYLFVFITEFLSLQIQKYHYDRQFLGVQLGRQGSWLTHICYADDILIFSQGTIAQLLTLIRITEDFTNVTGQSVSFHKSQIIFSKQISRMRREED